MVAVPVGFLSPCNFPLRKILQECVRSPACVCALYGRAACRAEEDPGRLSSEQGIKRFHAEAESAAKLDHPNIVPIIEVGEHEGRHYFSMAFVEVESLAHRISRGVFTPRDATELMKTVAAAIVGMLLARVIQAIRSILRRRAKVA